MYRQRRASPESTGGATAAISSDQIGPPDLAARSPGERGDHLQFRGAAHGCQLRSRQVPQLLEKRGGGGIGGTTHATTRSPHSGSGRFHTVTSLTLGWVIRTPSTGRRPDLLPAGDDDLSNAAEHGKGRRPAPSGRRHRWGATRHGTADPSRPGRRATHRPADQHLPRSGPVRPVDAYLDPLERPPVVDHPRPVSVMP